MEIKCIEVNLNKNNTNLKINHTMKNNKLI